jgi:hypothetical protein
MAKKRSYCFPKNSWSFKNKVSDNVNIPPIDSTTWQMHLPAHNMHIDNPDSLLEEQVHIFQGAHSDQTKEIKHSTATLPFYYLQTKMAEEAHLSIILMLLSIVGPR